MAEIPDIKIVKEIGAGGNGVVYRAHSQSLGEVALKTLHILKSPEAFQVRAGGEYYLEEEKKFVQEIETLMNFSHPNITKCFGIWYETKEGRRIPHMVFELGEASFADFLRNNEISKLYAIGFARQIVEAMIYLHENSTAHRDIKPGNMVICRKEGKYVLKLIDFGDSKYMSNNHMKTPVGTPVYVDPQVATGKYNKSVDIYSFGCVMVEMICGFESLLKWRTSKSTQNSVTRKTGIFNKFISTAMQMRKSAESQQISEDISSRMGKDLTNLVEGCLRSENKISLKSLNFRLRQLESKEIWKFYFKQVTLFHYSDLKLFEENFIQQYWFHLTIADLNYHIIQTNQVLKNYILSVNQGLLQTQFNLAFCYENGKGVEQDMKKAFELYTLSANQGYPLAQFCLALCYLNGEGVEQDTKKAIEYYTLSANQGCSVAQYNLARCYEHGKGVEQDMKKAIKYYTLSENQGCSKAQFYLGYCYEIGKGVEQDMKKAVKYYTLSAIQGHPVCSYLRSI